MSFSEPAPTAVRRRPIVRPRRRGRRGRGPGRDPRLPVADALVLLGHLPLDALVGDQHAARGAADGLLPDGVTVFDDEYPAVTNLDPALLAALRQAATDAADDGVELYVNSGWRSAGYQEQLLAEAVSEYGSKEEAARWVATPKTSPHVSGDAVDVGGSDCPGVAVRARPRVRAVPDLRQRAVALRAAPRGRRAGLPSDVRRPFARPADPPMTLGGLPRLSQGDGRQPGVAGLRHGPHPPLPPLAHVESRPEGQSVWLSDIKETHDTPRPQRPVTHPAPRFADRARGRPRVRPLRDSHPGLGARRRREQAAAERLRGAAPSGPAPATRRAREAGRRVRGAHAGRRCRPAQPRSSATATRACSRRPRRGATRP